MSYRYKAGWWVDEYNNFYHLVNPEGQWGFTTYHAAGLFGTREEAEAALNEIEAQ